MNSLKFRMRIALVLIILIGLLSCMQMFFVWTKELNDDDADLTSTYQNRYSQLKEYLPKEGILGYITILRPDDEEDTLARYYLTQFELTPLIISSDINRRFVIGDLKNNIEVKKIKEEYNFKILVEFQNGVALFDTGEK